jgi:hypothetical protein
MTSTKLNDWISASACQQPWSKIPHFAVRELRSVIAWTQQPLDAVSVCGSTRDCGRTP